MLTPDQLRQALAELGWTQQECADRLGVSLRTVQKWVAGDHRIPGPASRLVKLYVRREDLRPTTPNEVRGEEVLR